MNKYLSLMSLSALALMTSCSSNEEAQPETAVKSVTVTANLQPFADEVPTTRTQIDVSSSDQISYKWAIGDVLGIFPDAGTQTAFELSASSLSADGLSATFDGGAWALKAGHSYYSYFPFSYDCFSPSVNKTNIPVSYLGQKQVKFGDTTNAGQYDFNAAGAVSSNSGGLSFDFKRLGALLRIQFTIPATATYKTLTLSTSSSVIPVKGTVDLTASTLAFTPTEYASSLVIDLNNVSATLGETAYVYMMLPPMALKDAGIDMTATLSYGSKTTIYNLCSVGTTTKNTPNFTANTRYKREAVYASGDPVGKLDGGNDEETATSQSFTVKGVTFKMVMVDGGTFIMGATSEQTNSGYSPDSDESPTHSVTLSDYYIGETEVTQALWYAVMGGSPSSSYSWTSSYGLGDNYPAYYISYTECQDFISKLNTLTGKTFRMPTEAEWEYAARGGSKSKGYVFSGSNTIGDVAWYYDNSYAQGSSGSDYGTHPVATKQANELGIYDMSGNVYEWCSDWYGSYSSSSVTNPTGPSSGSYRVDRGGSWSGLATYCRVTDRDGSDPSGHYCLGLRLALQ